MNGLPAVTASLANRALITGALLMFSGSTYASVVVVGIVVAGVVGVVVVIVVTVIRSGVVAVVSCDVIEVVVTCEQIGQGMQN